MDGLMPPVSVLSQASTAKSKSKSKSAQAAGQRPAITQWPSPLSDGPWMSASVCREAWLSCCPAFHHLLLLAATLSLRRPRACNGALNTRQPPSASLHSPSPPPLQRPRFSISPKTSPGLCSVLTPHTSSVPALPGLIRHRLLVRVHSSHRRAPCQSRCRRPSTSPLR